MADTYGDCRSEEGITTGLIDAIITAARVLARRDLTPVAVREALADLRADEDLASLLAPSLSAVNGSAARAFATCRRGIRRSRRRTGCTPRPSARWRPNRNPDGTVKEVMVACDVHHVMADGAPASLHEVLCTCGNFADARDCTVYMDQDGEPEHVCNSEGCAAVLIADCGFRLPTDAERAEWRLPDPTALRGDTQ